MTLVELLMVIVVIGMILAIALPMLRGVIRGGRHVATLSNLRSNAQVLSSYAGDWEDRWPHFTKPGFLTTTVTGGGLSIRASYFDSHLTWPVAMADSYFGGSVFAPDAFYPPSAHPDFGVSIVMIRTALHYPCALIADPGYWNPTTRIGPAQYRATAAFEVRYAADKSLLVAAWPYVEQLLDAQRDVPVSAAMADASALSVSPSQRVSGHETGDGYQFRDDGAVHFHDYPPMLHTTDGVHGRDVVR